MFQVANFVKNCKFKMKCVEKYDAIPNFPDFS